MLAILISALFRPRGAARNKAGSGAINRAEAIQTES